MIAQIRHNPLESFALVWGLCFGVLLVFQTPLMQVADEPDHFFRSYQISEFDLFSERIDVRTGSDLPVELLLFPAPETNSTGTLKISRETLSKLSQTSALSGKRQFFSFASPSTYPPLGYLPQAAGIALSRVFGASLLTQFYWGRLFNLFVALGLVVASIKLIPIQKLALLLIALLPTAVYQRSSFSGDSFAHAYCLFFLSLHLFFALKKPKLEKKDRYLLYLSALLLALVKQNYAPMAILVLCFKPSQFQTRKDSLFFITFYTLCLLVPLLSWSHFIKPLIVPMGPGTDVNAQITYVIAHPLQTAGVVLENYWARGMGYLRWAVAQLGWADLYPPRWLQRYFVNLLLFAALTQTITERLTRRIRAVVFVSWIVCLGTLSLLVYLTGMEVGADHLRGLQGRYFIPYLALGAVCLTPNFKTRLDNSWIQALILVSVVIAHTKILILITDVAH